MAAKAVISACLLAATVAHADPFFGLDDEDHLALEQSVRFATSFETADDAARWLRRNSDALEPMVQDPFYRYEILRLIHAAARAEDLDPQLVLSLIQIESRFDRFAVSVSGARGLMQVMPFWIKEIGHPVDNLFYPETNLRYGCHILKRYLRRDRNNVRRALARYNGGGDPNYANKVLAAFNGRWAPQKSLAVAD